jgi:hypothetical protein
MKNSKSVTSKAMLNKAAPAPQKVDNTTALLVQLKKGNNSISSLKKGIIIAQLIKKHKMNPSAISKKSGISNATVYNAKKLSDMPEKVFNYVKEGLISPSEALTLSRNQPTDTAFIKSVETFIKMRKAAEKRKAKSNENFHNISATMSRKEQSLEVKVLNSEERSKLRKQLEQILAPLLPKRLSKDRIDMAATQLTDFIGLA